VEVFKSSTGCILALYILVPIRFTVYYKMAEQAINIRSSSAVMDLLLPLPLSHPSITNLLSLQPLAHPSSLSHSVIVKFLNRVNAAVLVKDGEREAKNGSSIALKLVEDDQEGWVLSEYGKGWVNVCLTELAVCTSTTS
jgi:hypothetical protein